MYADELEVSGYELRDTCESLQLYHYLSDWLYTSLRQRNTKLKLSKNHLPNIVTTIE